MRSVDKHTYGTLQLTESGAEPWSDGSFGRVPTLGTALTMNYNSQGIYPESSYSSERTLPFFLLSLIQSHSLLLWVCVGSQH